MRTAEDVFKCAAEQSLTEEAVLKKKVEENAKEFAGKGA